MTISKKRITEIAAIADEDIDTSDIPEVTEERFKRATLVLPGDHKLRRPVGNDGHDER
jgi:hypothetical protein